MPGSWQQPHMGAAAPPTAGCQVLAAARATLKLFVLASSFDFILLMLSLPACTAPDSADPSLPEHC